MEKIRVLHLYKKSILESYGGVEKFIDTLCKCTYEFDIDNILFSLSKRNLNQQISLEKYIVINAKQDIYIFSTGFSIQAFSKFKKLASSVDIIHYHFPYPFADILHFLCGIRKPFLITYHSDIVKQKLIFFIYRFLMNKFLKASNRIVATSSNYLNSSPFLSDHLKKVEIIPIGIDLKDYPKIDKKILENYKKRFKCPFFLFVGSLRYYKGLEFALRAIAGTDFKLVIAGDGDLKYKLLKLAKNLKLYNVTFLGEINDKEKVCLLSLCKCFIFPSNRRSEAFGISLLEAAAFGKPMISCEIGTGTSFINIHNHTGLVIKPNSPEDIRNAMKFIISNPEIASRMASNAKKRYLEIFTAGKQAKEYNRIYRHILKK